MSVYTCKQVSVCLCMSMYMCVSTFLGEHVHVRMFLCEHCVNMRGHVQVSMSLCVSTFVCDHVHV